MRILTVVGARPQFVKASVVSRAIAASRKLSEELVHTGQHYDENLSDRFFAELEIPPPSASLGIGSAPQGAQTGRMLEAVERVICNRRPDRVLVYGDTNSTLAGALAAAKLGVPVAHVEAGVRSFNRQMSEEINRVLTDQIADLLLAPTGDAVENLHREGVSLDRIHKVGDVMLDAVRDYSRRAAEQSQVIRDLDLEGRRYALVTLHRAENTNDGNRLRNLVGALCELAKRVTVVFPLHPRTAAALHREKLFSALDGQLRLTEPQGYLDMTRLLQSASLVATDSGGLQKEAFFHGVRCVTLRTETEWVELVRGGWNQLAPPDDATLVTQALIEALDATPIDASAADELYGGGRAAERVAAVLEGAS